MFATSNITEATPGEVEFIDNQIVEFNKAQVPFTQEQKCSQNASIENSMSWVGEYAEVFEVIKSNSIKS